MSTLPVTHLPVTLADIKAAAAAIAGAVVHTPTRHSRTLSAIAGCEIWLKFENRQFTASFKERGALNISAPKSFSKARTWRRPMRWRAPSPPSAISLSFTPMTTSR
jgi:threonine dehydratase